MTTIHAPVLSRKISLRTLNCDCLRPQIKRRLQTYFFHLLMPLRLGKMTKNHTHGGFHLLNHFKYIISCRRILPHKLNMIQRKTCSCNLTLWQERLCRHCLKLPKNIKSRGIGSLLHLQDESSSLLPIIEFLFKLVVRPCFTLKFFFEPVPPMFLVIKKSWNEKKKRIVWSNEMKSFLIIIDE